MGEPPAIMGEPAPPGIMPMGITGIEFIIAPVGTIPLEPAPAVRSAPCAFEKFLNSSFFQYFFLPVFEGVRQPRQQSASLASNRHHHGANTRMQARMLRMDAPGVWRGAPGALVGAAMLVLALLGTAAGGPDAEERNPQEQQQHAISGARPRGMSLRIYRPADGAESRALTAAEAEALLGMAGKEGARADALRWVGLELDVAAEALRMEATQDMLVEVAADLLGRAGVRRSWKLPPLDAGTKSQKYPV
jgi:hypothetical protein